MIPAGSGDIVREYWLPELPSRSRHLPVGTWGVALVAWLNGGVRLILTCVSPLTSLAEILTSIKFSGEGLWREWYKDNSIHYRPYQPTRRILRTPADDSTIRNSSGNWNLRIAPTFFLEPGCWTELRKQSLFCYLFTKVKHHHKNRAYISRNLQAACRKISWRFKKRRPRIYMAEWSVQNLFWSKTTKSHPDQGVTRDDFAGCVLKVLQTFCAVTKCSLYVRLKGLAFWSSRIIDLENINTVSVSPIHV